MWFMNKIANPFVRLILRSPLYWLLGTSLLLINYRGRKSGKEYTLPVNYTRDGDHIYILPAMPEQKTWWRNLKGGAPVRVTIDGQTLPATGALLEQKDQETIIKGLELVLRHFPTLVKYIPVGLDADGHLNANELRAAAAGLVMIRVELDRK